MHVSKGEGRERHIEVLKTNCQQPDNDTQKTNSVISNDLVSDVDVTDVSASGNVNENDMLSQDKDCISDVDDTQMSSLNEHITGSQQSCEAATSATEHVDSNSSTETADLPSETNSTLSTLCCSNCGRQVPQLNYQLHLLQCRSSGAKSTNKKNRVKSSNKVSCLLPAHGDILCK